MVQCRFLVYIKSVKVKQKYVANQQNSACDGRFKVDLLYATFCQKKKLIEYIMM
jgi:hypothetical protein